MMSGGFGSRRGFDVEFEFELNRWIIYVCGYERVCVRVRRYERIKCSRSVGQRVCHLDGWIDR